MAVHSKSVSEFTSVDITKAKPGLIYDAEGVTLLGKYTDELAAHRARKEWQLILNSHFLLEAERDYELNTFCDLGEEHFLLSCCFLSACGRYAFWRLVNRQAPEAEHKLNGCKERIQKSAKNFLGSSWSNENKETTFVVNALEEQLQRNEENTSLVNKLLQLFK